MNNLYNNLSPEQLKELQALRNHADKLFQLQSSYYRLHAQLGIGEWDQEYWVQLGEEYDKAEEDYRFKRIELGLPVIAKG